MKSNMGGNKCLASTPFRIALAMAMAAGIAACSFETPTEPVNPAEDAAVIETDATTEPDAMEPDGGDTCDSAGTEGCPCASSANCAAGFVCNTNNRCEGSDAGFAPDAAEEPDVGTPDSGCTATPLDIGCDCSGNSDCTSQNCDVGLGICVSALPDAGFAPDSGTTTCVAPRAVGCGCFANSDCDSANCDPLLQLCVSALPDAGTPDVGFPDAGFASDATVVTTDAGICTTPNGFGCTCVTSDDCLNRLSCQFGICLPNPDASVPNPDATVAPDTGTLDSGFADAAQQDAAAADATTPDSGISPDSGFAPDATVAPDSGTPAACTPGTIDCECNVDGTCDYGTLECRQVLISYASLQVASRCVPNDCPDGDVGCPCRPDGTCGTGLVCLAASSYIGYPPVYYCALTPDAGISDTGVRLDATIADSGTTDASNPDAAALDATSPDASDGGTIADASADAAVDGGTTPDSGADAGTLPPLNPGITVISSTVTMTTFRIRWVATASEMARFPTQINRLDMYVECNRIGGGVSSAWAVYASNSRNLPETNQRLQREFTFIVQAGDRCKMNVQGLDLNGLTSFWAASDQGGQQTVVGHFEADVPGSLRGSSINVVRHTTDSGYDWVLTFAP